MSLILSASENQARICFDYAARAYRRLAEPVAAESFNKRSLELSNGSKFHVVAASPHTVRGYHADTLLIDEAAYVEEEVLDAIWPSIIVTEGPIVLSSTPNGRSGLFFEVFNSTDPAWHRVKVTPKECGLSDAAIAEFRKLKGDDLTRQEFGCEFLDSQGAAFDSEQIDRLWGKSQWWEL